MPERRTERRLAAIVATDMVGYSRLMQADETGTIARQKAHRKDLIDPKIAEYYGRIVNTTGDGLIIEFASAVDAVQCAVEVQRAMAEREAKVPEDTRIRYRVGINIGDIVIDGDDIQGDGVIIAARLETLAEPGGICISRNVFNQIKNKVDLGFKDLGPQNVKNIAEPVPAYKVLFDPEDKNKLIPPKRKLPPLGRRAVSIAAGLLLVIVAGIVWWRPWVTRVEPASIAKMAFPLPKKPSIAVLPFDNLSGDPKHEHLADGLSENIISSLSKVSEMFVIARNSSFIYKGKAVKVQQVAEELGVRYVLEGSVQRDGERIRVTAQLIDAVKGHHLWSEHYDRKAEDWFAIQDDITQRIVGALSVQLTDGERLRLLRRSTSNLKAWLLAIQAKGSYRKMTKEANIRAKRLAKQAIQLDPKFAYAYVVLGYTHNLDVRFGWTGSRADSQKKIAEIAQKALELDDGSPDPHLLLALLHLSKRQHTKAVAFGERAVNLSPNDSDMYYVLGYILRYSGQPDRSIRMHKKAMRLSPYYPPYYLYGLAFGYYQTRRYVDAIAALNEMHKRQPVNAGAGHVLLAAIYTESGRQADARRHIAEALKRSPHFTLKYADRVHPFKEAADKNRFLAALRKAGLPENSPLPLPKKPSIAVLPFTNISGDKAQEYFADGMTDDLITGLSKVSGLIVVSRTSAFTFKGKKVKIKDIARALGVRYVLEGSVRRAGGMVRINAQLIDATIGGHIWAETFDRDYKQIFALQDEVKGKIIQALKVKLTTKEHTALKRRPTDNLEAYDLYLKAEKLRLTYQWRRYRAALALYDKVLKLDPEFIDAHVGNARASFRAWRLGWLPAIPAPKAKVRVQKALAKVLALDPGNASALAVQVDMQLQLQNHDVALALARGAVARHPQNAILQARLARVLLASDKLDEARAALTRAEDLAPKPSPELLIDLARDYLMLGEAGRAVPLLLRARKGGGSRLVTAVLLTNAYARLGDMERAKAELETARKIWPAMNVAWSRITLAHYRNQRLLKNYFDASLKAGVPEWPHGFKGRAEHRLRQTELETLFRRGPFKQIGTDHFGRRFETLGDGKGNETYVSFRGRSRIRIPRKTVIERDMLCYRNDFTMIGRKICTEVYRNPEGSPKTNNEYILTYIFGLHRFSIKPVK